MSNIHSPVGRLVSISVRFPLVAVIVAFALGAGALFYTARHFAMTTDTAQLISTKLEWRQRELAFEAAFPQLQKLDIVVIDAATPELADVAAARLTAALERKPELFRTVRQPEGDAFFRRNGLLFLPVADVQATTAGLTRSASFLGALAADPSLRGVLSVLSGMAQAVEHGQGRWQDIEPMMSALAHTFEEAAAGRPAFFSWRRLIPGMPAAGTERPRRVVIVQPVLDFAGLQPGLAASEAIRATARSLGLDAAHGISVRLTGPVPLTDEEFATLAQDADVVAGAMVVALLGILWLAVRSARVVFAILATTLMGLVMTAAVGLIATGRFNLISVAFIPLFVGLGVDFSIQLSVRFLAERRLQPGIATALIAAGNGVGTPLALAATAIGVGFFAFLPTDYLGVAELGTIAGLGMIVAFVLSVTLLPALLVLLRPASTGFVERGYPGLAAVEHFLAAHRRTVLVLGLLAAVASLGLLPFVRFDFDPLHLKSDQVESMATLRDLSSDADFNPNTINVLVPPAVAPADVAHRLDALPDVARTISLASFVPSQQPEKLAIIGDAAAHVLPALGGKAVAPPADADLLQSLASTGEVLRRASATTTGPAAALASRLETAMDRLRAAPPEMRASAADAVVLPLETVLDQLRDMLQAAPVTLESLPADLVGEWTARDGRRRIQVFPRAGAADEQALWRFAEAVQRIAPDATGTPISIHAAGTSIVDAFLQAGAFAAVGVTVILAFALRRLRDVVLTLVPVLLSGLLTFATCGALDLPLNFANIIALPLLFGVGVAFNIYFVLAWRAGETSMLQSSLMRAVVFSALTTATAFGALWLSSHPGTASMGRLLMISLGWEILITLLFRPALLARSTR